MLRRRLVDDLADLRAAGEEDEIPVLFSSSGVGSRSARIQ
jgi:hypothetical protein